MTLSSKVQFSVLAAAIVLVCWQLAQHRRQEQELGAVEAQIREEGQKLEARRASLAEQEQRTGEVQEAERRAGNGTLLALMRERAAANPAAQRVSQKHNVGGAVASGLDDPGQQQIDREAVRNEKRANMGLFFNLVHLSPEKIDQYIDVEIEKQSRNAKRKSALLRGELAVADALRQRDADNAELEQQQRAILGTEGVKFLDSIADGMRNDEAKRQVNGLRQAMSGTPLDEGQSQRLQDLIKTQLVTLPGEDTDLFRSPEEWTQMITERHENILRAAADFLSSAQLESLRGLAAYDLAARQKQITLQRKALGIK